MPNPDSFYHPGAYNPEQIPDQSPAEKQPWLRRFGSMRLPWGSTQDMLPSKAYRDGYCSAFGVAFWYVRNIVTWWRFPYWVAEWDHRYSMKPMPASIQQWSQPLPLEQWAKPSSALLAKTAEIEKAFAKGQSFMDHFNSTLGKAANVA
jgi:hypothetical protein